MVLDLISEVLLNQTVITYYEKKERNYCPQKGQI